MCRYGRCEGDLSSDSSGLFCPAGSGLDVLAPTKQVPFLLLQHLPPPAPSSYSTSPQNLLCSGRSVHAVVGEHLDFQVRGIILAHHLVITWSSPGGPHLAMLQVAANSSLTAPSIDFSYLVPRASHYRCADYYGVKKVMVRYSLVWYNYNRSSSLVLDTTSPMAASWPLLRKAVFRCTSYTSTPSYSSSSPSFSSSARCNFPAPGSSSSCPMEPP